MAVEVLEGDTPETLQRRVMEQAEWELLPKALEMVFKKVIEEEGGAEPLADVEADVEADEAAQEAETAASEE